jgi:hypothetical protein
VIASPEETNRGCLKYLAREIILVLIAGILMSIPCIICATWIFSLED